MAYVVYVLVAYLAGLVTAIVIAVYEVKRREMANEIFLQKLREKFEEKRREVQNTSGDDLLLLVDQYFPGRNKQTNGNENPKPDGQESKPIL